jgi:hypothetical protein
LFKLPFFLSKKRKQQQKLKTTKMRREDKKKLTINRRIIVNNLDELESILDYLIAKQIFTPAIRERIIYGNEEYKDRIRQMLDCLVTRNALAFQCFLEALVLTNNESIANQIEPTFTKSESYRKLIEQEHYITTALNATKQKQLSIPVTCTQRGHDIPSDISSVRSLINVNCHHLHSISTPLLKNDMIHRRLQTRPPISPHLSHHLYRYSNNSSSPVTSRSRSSSVSVIYNSNSSSPRSKSFDECDDKLTISPSPSPSPSATTTTKTTPTNVLSMATKSSPATKFQSQPPTYNIDWNDVNNLQLDFVVYKSLASIQEQSRNFDPNEVKKVF